MSTEHIGLAEIPPARPPMVTHHLYASPAALARVRALLTILYRSHCRDVGMIGDDPSLTPDGLGLKAQEALALIEPKESAGGTYATEMTFNREADDRLNFPDEMIRAKLFELVGMQAFATANLGGPAVIIDVEHIEAHGKARLRVTWCKADTGERLPRAVIHKGRLYARGSYDIDTPRLPGSPMEVLVRYRMTPYTMTGGGEHNVPLSQIAADEYGEPNPPVIA